MAAIPQLLNDFQNDNIPLADADQIGISVLFLFSLDFRFRLDRH